MRERGLDPLLLHSWLSIPLQNIQSGSVCLLLLLLIINVLLLITNFIIYIIIRERVQCYESSKEILLMLYAISFLNLI